MTIEEAVKASKDTFLSCQDFAEVEGCPPCCGSCHGEWDSEYADPREQPVFGKTAMICCAVHSWLEVQLKLLKELSHPWG
jgi:hypothetical protein